MSLSLGIVGFGNRVCSMYLPAIKALNTKVRTVGIVRRNPSRSAEVLEALDVPVFDSVDTMVAQTDVNAILICVPPESFESVAYDCMRCRLPFIMDTPLSHVAVVNEAAAAGIIGAVCEQKPHLPFEEFKRLLVDSGKLGRVFLLVNDFGGYEYHAVAVARTVVGLDKEIEAISGMRVLSQTGPVQNPSGVTIQTDEAWDIGTVEFQGGVVFSYHGNSLATRSGFRGPCTVRTYCDFGTITQTGLETPIVEAALGGRVESVQIMISGDLAYAPREIEATFSDGQRIVWRNSFESPLTHDQYGIAKHLERFSSVVTNGNGTVLHSLRDGFLDWYIVQQIRSSATQKLMFRRG